MARSLDELKSTLADARNTYGGQFAGQPRYTRQPARLEALIAQAEAVARDARGQAGGGDVSADAAQQAQTWRDELAEILKIQAQGPEAGVAASLTQWTRDSFERYVRNFAGQNRATRDLGILLEITADVEGRLRDLEAALARRTDADLEQMRGDARRNLDTYRKEIDAIRATRQDGSPVERAGQLARLANQQFARYRLHFAGKQRASRRRAVLETIVTVLEEIRQEMATLRDRSPNLDGLGRNIEIVDGNLATYREEIERVRAARRANSRNQVVSSLAEAANEVFADYRKEFPGHARATRDETRLSELWERLWPIALDMDALAAEDNAEPLGTNLQKVRDTLRLYEREWRLIREAKKA
jgi:hypothetical protein